MLMGCLSYTEYMIQSLIATLSGAFTAFFSFKAYVILPVFMLILALVARIAHQGRAPGDRENRCGFRRRVCGVQLFRDADQSRDSGDHSPARSELSRRGYRLAAPLLRSPGHRLLPR